MGKRNVPQGENGTYTSKTHKTGTYTGKHRKGIALGTDAQRTQNQKVAGSDLPPRGGENE